MAALLDFFKTAKINLTNCIVEPDTASNLNNPDFEVSPKDFLNYSKQDFKSSEPRGYINALTNAKRAIDCQVDKIFWSLGLDPNNFPKNIQEFVYKSNHSPSKTDIPIRFKFLQALGFAPAYVVSNVRSLRNKLEHYYKKPSEEEVSNAIELAELFILATDSKLRNVWDFSITDSDKFDKESLSGIYFWFNYQKLHFELTVFLGKRKRKVSIKNTDNEFYYLLKIATSFDYEEDTQDAVIELIKFIEHPIPLENISVKIE